MWLAVNQYNVYAVKKSAAVRLARQMPISSSVNTTKTRFPSYLATKKQVYMLLIQSLSFPNRNYKQLIWEQSVVTRHCQELRKHKYQPPGVFKYRKLLYIFGILRQPTLLH